MATVNLKKSYSALNEKLAKQFDDSGVRRSFTVPYIEGQNMSDHVQAVGQAASQMGGMTKNLITTFHHSDGKGYGTGDGRTVGHPGDKLRSTIIPKDSETAKATVAAAQKHLDNIADLLGDNNPAVKVAKGQLALVKKTDGAGMNLADFGSFMIQIMYRPNQAVAQAHDQNKEGGIHPKLRPPAPEAAPAPQDGAGAPQGEEQASADPSAPESAPAASAAPGAAPVAAPQQA